MRCPRPAWRRSSSPWQAAERGAVTWRRTPAHERMRILLRAAALADERTPQIAATISAENGKTITEATLRPAAPAT